MRPAGQRGEPVDDRRRLRSGEDVEVMGIGGDLDRCTAAPLVSEVEDAPVRRVEVHPPGATAVVETEHKRNWYVHVVGPRPVVLERVRRPARVATTSFV